jgi:hypothetical protein
LNIVVWLFLQTHATAGISPWIVLRAASVQSWHW